MYSDLFKLVSLDSESGERVEDPDHKVAEFDIEGWEMFSFFPPQKSFHSKPPGLRIVFKFQVAEDIHSATL